MSKEPVKRALSYEDITNKKTKFDMTKGGKKKSSRKKPEKDEQVAYHGPVVLPKSSEEATVYPQNFSYTNLVNADGGGVIAQVFSTEDVRSSSDWGNISSSYDEYRVVAMEVLYVPIIRYDTAFPYPPMITVVDRSDIAAMSSYSTSATHESAVMKIPNKIWRRVIKMKSTEESDFIATSAASPTSWGSIKIYGSGFTASASYARFQQVFLVQFRGRA